MTRVRIMAAKCAARLAPPPEPRLGWLHSPRPRFYIGHHTRWVERQGKDLPITQREELVRFGGFLVGWWPSDNCCFLAYGTGWWLKLPLIYVSRSYGNGGRWTRGLRISVWGWPVVKIGHTFLPG